MKFTAGETLTVTYEGAELVIKIEDASKSESISARVEQVKKGEEKYTVGQVYEFRREEL